MRRRAVLAILAGAMPVSMAARAQQPGRIYRIGVLEAVPAAQNTANLQALRKRLGELGYEEGRNLVIEYRSADGRAERFAELAAELVALKVDLILTRGTPATRAAKDATDTIPTVMATMGDPRRLVASFARPGGNITGVTTFTTELTAKRVEILKELVPGLARLALLHNMANPAVPPEWEETKQAAGALGLEAELLDIRAAGDIEPAFETASRGGVGALVVGADGLTQREGKAIVALAARYRLAAIYPSREFVEAGGLIAYGISYPDLYRRLADLAGKVLKGANPADLPVEQPARFEMLVNLKTANALGVAVPSHLLALADEVIE
jgi:putative ABC transport system substrate-binding protein